MSKLVEKILNEAKIITFANPKDSNFIVLIGSPGAGKSFIKDNFLHLDNFKNLNVDNWIEMIGRQKNLNLNNPENTSEINKNYEDKYKVFRTNFIKNQLKTSKPINIVVDITGKSIESVNKVLNLVNDSNYTTTLVYVVTSKEECLKRNLSRIRTIPEDFLISIYDDIQKTYTQIFSQFDNVWIVSNNDLWNTFYGNEEYVIIDGKKILKSREGSFERPIDRIFKVK